MARPQLLAPTSELLALRHLTRGSFIREFLSTRGPKIVSPRWLEEPQEWRAIPHEELRKAVVASPVKDRLDWIVNRGAAGKPYVV